MLQNMIDFTNIKQDANLIGNIANDVNQVAQNKYVKQYVPQSIVNDVTQGANYVQGVTNNKDLVNGA